MKAFKIIITIIIAMISIVLITNIIEIIQPHLFKLLIIGIILIVGKILILDQLAKN